MKPKVPKDEFPLKFYLLFLLPAIFLYFKTLKFGYTLLDEQWMIVSNEKAFTGENAFKECFTKQLAGLYYRPLFLVTLVIDYNFGGLMPRIYHFTNLLWHLTAMVLLFEFLKYNRSG